MLPPPLRLELLPRRRRRGLRAGVLLVCGAALAALVAPLLLRQRQVEQGVARAQQAAAHAASHAAPAAHPPPAPAWQAGAAQEGRLLRPGLAARLLEIERCTGAHTVVRRIAHDAAAGVTRLELRAAPAADLGELVGCLNAGSGASRWRLGMAEVPPAGGLRVVLGHEEPPVPATGPAPATPSTLTR